MRALVACLLLLPLAAAAELNGLAPERRAALETLMADPRALSAEALATSRALEQWEGREQTTLELRKAWSLIEELDARTRYIGDRLRERIASRLGDGRITAEVAAGHRRCVEDSVNARLVLIYGHVWPRTISETFEEAGIILPAALRARLAQKAYASEAQALAFAECGARMAADGIFPPNP